MANFTYEYPKPSEPPGSLPKTPLSAGPVPLAVIEWQTAHKFLKTFSPLAGSPAAFFFGPIVLSNENIN
jgi:hypothetical protein